MGNIVSHDTNVMNEWSSKMEDSNNEYENLVNTLYSVGDELLNIFKGGVADEFSNVFMEAKKPLMSYSETFKECTDLMRKISNDIDSDEQALSSSIRKNNLF